MKRNLLLFIGIIAILFPMSLNAQEGPKFSGFVQGLWQSNIDHEGNVMDNTFQARRVRLSLDGKLIPDLSYKIQGDFVNSPMLVDAYLKYKVNDAFSIQAGQFKTPFTLESPINPVNLEIFDYGESVKSLCGYSDVCGVGGLGRDLGIMVSGNLFRIKDKDDDKNKEKGKDEGFPLITYSVGVFNGNGPVSFKKNEKGLDNNNRKDFVGRLEVHPMLKALTVSGSFYYGFYDKDQIHNGLRQRWTAGAQYKDDDLIVRAEYLNGATGLGIDHGQPNDPEIISNSEGYYLVAGYNVRFGKNNSQKLMPVVRYEYLAPEKDPDFTVGTAYYTVGVNYWPIESLNFKLDYSLIQTISSVKENNHRVVIIGSYKF